MPTDDLDARMNAPQGAWPGDLDNLDVQGRRLSASEHAIVRSTGNERFVMKFFYSLTGQDVTPRVIREMRMMLLAGEDISVKVEGRLFMKGKLEGFVMSCETTLDLGLPKATKLHWIEQLQSLARSMHKKGIIHGDLKPDNVLVRNGQLVLCDWAAAQLKAEAVQPSEGTTAYQSAWRCRQYDLPLCTADDLYALGVTIWHIWLGRPPFNPGEHENLHKEIANGLKPDLDEVDDKTVRSLIYMYLKSAPAGDIQGGKGGTGPGPRLGSLLTSIDGSDLPTLTLSEFCHTYQLSGHIFKLLDDHGVEEVRSLFSLGNQDLEKVGFNMWDIAELRRALTDFAPTPSFGQTA